MTTFKNFLVLMIALIILNGCVANSNHVEPVTLTNTKIVGVPVKPDEPENLDCEFEGEGTEPIRKLMACVSYLKNIIKEITVDPEEKKQILEEQRKLKLKSITDKIEQPPTR